MKKIDLSGLWQFTLDQEKQGIKNEFYNQGFTGTIRLPGTTAMAQKGEVNLSREIGYLTEEYPFSGYAWYEKELTLSKEQLNRPIKLYLERTRLTKVWINGNYVGAQDSLCNPHEYDLTNWITTSKVRITLCVDNASYPIKGGHMTSRDTQTNWNGIIGAIELRVYPPIYLKAASVSPNLQLAQVASNLRIISRYDQSLKAEFKWELTKVTIESEVKVSSPKQKVSWVLEPGVNERLFVYQMNRDFEPWNEYHPVCYRLELISEEGEICGTIWFGMREFTADAHHFYINGDKTFLRGKHDGLIFPLTGATPSSIDEWLQVFRVAKEYGINHYRYHTCCPPETAFIAADLMGMYLEPELPFWGTMTAPGDEDHQELEQQYLIEEGKGMLRAYGNHPSFVMFSLGNELWGSKEQIAKIIREFKEVDSRPLYTQGSNNFQFAPVILDEEDFFVGVRFSGDRLIRGSYAMCDAPLGFVQMDVPGTCYSIDQQIMPTLTEESSEAFIEEIEIQYETGTKTVLKETAVSWIPHKPVISHEIGQYAMFPNCKEIKKYTGVLKARNFEVFKERLEAAGMLEQGDLFFQASGKLAVQCYKLELEAAFRSQYLAGFQMLDLQDFSGQGTALVGVLDAFMDSKGLVEPMEWRQFCSDLMVMAQIDQFIYESGDKLQADLLISCHRPHAKREETCTWKLMDGDQVFDRGQVEGVSLIMGVATVGQIEFMFPRLETPRKLTLVITLVNNQIVNQYDLWIFPKQQQIPEESFITDQVEEAEVWLQEGKKVLLVSKALKSSLEGFYCTDFWCYPMFRSISEKVNKPIPQGTMGLLVNHEHPALKYFPSDYYSTPQWYQIVTNGSFAILNETPASYSPIVQVIDNFERNFKLGLLFEAKVGSGHLLVCTCDQEELMKYPEGRQFLFSLAQYILSEDFQPELELDLLDQFC